MFYTLMLTICLHGQPCKAPQRMSGPIDLALCEGMRTKADANILRHNRRPSRVDCQPATKQQVATK